MTLGEAVGRMYDLHTEYMELWTKVWPLISKEGDEERDQDTRTVVVQDGGGRWLQAKMYMHGFPRGQIEYEQIVSLNELSKMELGEKEKYRTEIEFATACVK